jgi:16S rRNA (guanine527-N7)-methyltransferase
MTEADAKALIAGDVSRETCDRLVAFADLLLKWQNSINLIAASTIPSLWQRHILDSVQLMQHVPPTAQRWLDLGSGGGFPGLVCAAIAHERLPSLVVTLVESDQRKATFLREAARLMGLSVVVHSARISDIPNHNADIITARALAPLPRLFEMAYGHCADGGICLFQKGASYAAEIYEARMEWHFACEAFASVTAPDAVVLRIEKLRHV